MTNCKILMLIPVWRRPDVLELFVNNLNNVQPDYCEVIPFFILSHDDPELRQNENLTSDFLTCFAANHPLGEKMNRGIREALTLKWDYLMVMGSDDVYTALFWILLEDYLLCGEPWFGLVNLHVMELYGGRARFIPNYHLNMENEVTIIGPGSCLRRDIAERMHPLYPAMHQGLNNWTDRKLRQAGFKPLKIESCDPVICDLKTDTHLWPYEFFDDMGPEVDAKEVAQAFGIVPRKAPFKEFHAQVLKESRNERKTDSFQRVNEWHQTLTEVVRYSTYNSYHVMVYKKHKK